MLTASWVQLFLLVVVLTILFMPLGNYMSKVFDPKGKTIFDWILKPLERGTYKILRLDPLEEQSWKGYLFSVLIFSAISFLATFLLLLFQGHLPLNPLKYDSLSLDLAFNTAVSFMTNTNWQSYSGESTLSFGSQMWALTAQNFLSPAVGLCVAAALVRGLVRSEGTSLGNFWVDLIRSLYYLLLPLAILFALLFLWQGVPQNFLPSAEIATLQDGSLQTIVEGPIASQEAIKLLGTNGGGFTNVNSAHPYENPTSFSNFLEILALLLIPVAQFGYFGIALKRLKHAWSIYFSLLIVFIAGVLLIAMSETQGMPWLEQLGVDPFNWEGKEVRCGLWGSSIFAAATTCTSTGAVDTMHASLTPISGLITMVNMQLSEVIFGGVGAGLYSLILFVILAIFIAGLVIGRTPEYLGKKLEAFDIKMVVISLLFFLIAVVGFTSWACTSEWGKAGLDMTGPHGFSEMLYAYSSCAANNGSAFASLSANTPWYNYTLSAGMLLGRFGTIIPVLALAGSLRAKKCHPETDASFPISGMTFMFLLLGAIIIVGVLTFLPALLMGPIFEEVMLILGKFL